MLRNFIGIVTIILIIYIKVKYFTLVGLSLICYYLLLLAVATGFFGSQITGILKSINGKVDDFLVRAKAEFERGREVTKNTVV